MKAAPILVLAIIHECFETFANSFTRKKKKFLGVSKNLLDQARHANLTRQRRKEGRYELWQKSSQYSAEKQDWNNLSRVLRYNIECVRIKASISSAQDKYDALALENNSACHSTTTSCSCRAHAGRSQTASLAVITECHSNELKEQ